MRSSGDPKPALTVLHAAVLAAEVDALALLAVLVAALGEVAGAGGELRLDGRVGGDPVCEGIFAVLNDSAGVYYYFLFEVGER